MHDDDLIRRCAADPDAFRELVARFRARLYSFLIHLAGPQAADDVFQEVWLKVLRSAPSYEARGKAASWLFKIAHRAALDHLARRSRAGEPAGLDDEAGRLSDPAPQPPAEAEARETRARLAAALASLPLEQREVFLMREYGGLAFREIAAELGVPLGTALSRMNYALGKLRISLEDYHA